MSSERLGRGAACAITLLAIVACAQRPAYAGLGGAPGSSAAALPQARAIVQPGSNADKVFKLFTLKRFVSPEGTQLREYSANGKVFGVSWKGPHEPDLKVLLGDYYREWQGSDPVRPGQPVFFEKNGLTIQMGGHTGRVTGRVYADDLAPKGVNPAHIVW